MVLLSLAAEAAEAAAAVVVQVEVCPMVANLLERRTVHRLICARSRHSRRRAQACISIIGNHPRRNWGAAAAPTDRGPHPESRARSAKLWDHHSLEEPPAGSHFDLRHRLFKAPLPTRHLAVKAGTNARGAMFRGIGLKGIM